MRFAKYIVVAIGLVSLATPLGLRAVGVTANQFENHAFAPAPKLSQGWDVFPQMTQFFTDRMPLREQAVTANRKISENIFDTEPVYGARDLPGVPGTATGAIANIVTPGKSGWLYVTESLANACKANRPVSIAAANRAWAALRTSLVRRGKKVLIVVVPDKDTIYPEYLPDSFPQKDCLPQDRDELWNGLARAGDGFLPLRSVMRTAKQRNRGLIYFQRDSHWNDIGGTYLPRTVLPVLDSKVKWDPGAARVGTIKDVGDLAGTLYFKQAKPVDVPYIVSMDRDPAAPRVPGDTVLLGDSFSADTTITMPPYLDHYTRLIWDSVSTVGTPSTTAATARRLLRANTVILEVAERHYLQMAKPVSAPLPGPTGVVLPNIKYLTEAIQAQQSARR